MKKKKENINTGIVPSNFVMYFSGLKEALLIDCC